jgi:AmiR/NasT family two-component response regulator
MPSVLLIATADAPDIEADLRAFGSRVIARAGPATLVQEAARTGCDIVLAWDPYPAQGLLPALEALGQHAPRPVLLFTSDTDAATLAEALRCGAHGYVVNGYAAARLRPLLQLARARFEREAELRTAHAALADRFEERKLVDRAKGILMRAHQIPEDEAFRLLRQASMQEQQRVGQVSRRVIDAARDADTVNRAGQLRMLSQRIVKLHALQCAGVEAAVSAQGRQISQQLVASHIDQLARELSQPTFGDLLDAVARAWEDWLPLLRPEPRRESIVAVDAGAERLLQAAEALAAALEAASPLATLAIVNRAGRQRMLSQRLAKQALLATLCEGAPAQAAADDAVRSIEAFEAALRLLEQAPLSSAGIRAELEAATAQWHRMLAGLHDAGSERGRATIAACSETLLAQFERLTGLYVRGAQQLFEVDA